MTEPPRNVRREIMRREVPMRQAVYRRARRPAAAARRPGVMRGGNLLALSKILRHAKMSMTEKYAHLAPDHLRAEIARTERAVEPVVGSGAQQTTSLRAKW